MTCGAVVVAAGQSRRMGFDKTLTSLAGRTVLFRVLDVIDQSPDVMHITVVTATDMVEALRRDVQSEPYRHSVHVVAGGETRPESVRNGVRALPGDVDMVLIHDAARPLVTLDIVERGVRTAIAHGAAIAAMPVTDTIKQVAPDGSIEKTVDRSHLYAAQTPQVFRRSWLDEAYARLGDDLATGGFTDEASLLEQAGYHVKVFPGSNENIKLTMPSDLDLADAILARRERIVS